MKKILAIVLVMLLLCSLFAACGGSSEPSTASSAPSSTAPAANDQDDEEEEADDAATGMSAEEYEAGMGEFIPAFEEICGNIGELVAMSEEISNEEQLIVWAQTYIDVKDNIGLMADELANLTAQVPEEYQESHVKITIAVAAIYDAMTGFEYAVDAALNGDAEAFEDGIAEFVGNIVAADALWEEAVE